MTVGRDAAVNVEPLCAGYPNILGQGFAPTSFPVEVVIDRSVSNHTITVVLDAISLWNLRLGAEVLYASVTQDTEMHEPCNYAVLNTNMQFPGPTVGITIPRACASDAIFIETMDTYSNPAQRARYDDNFVRQIAEHEFGHALGLEHEVFDPTSIMYPYIDGSPRSISTYSYCLVQVAYANAEASQSEPSPTSQSSN